MSEQLPVSERSQLRRIPSRASYDRALAHAILDVGLICHVGFATGTDVFVIPMAYARQGDQLLLHGSVASRLAKSLAGGVRLSVCVTLMDGLVLARSVFEHSMNYRSVVCFGHATAITDPTFKAAALRDLTEHLIPGRWEDARQPNTREIQATTVLAMPLQEISIKTRAGPPEDLQKDMELPYWAGVLPLQLRTAAAIPDPALAAHTPLPSYVSDYARPGQRSRL